MEIIEKLMGEFGLNEKQVKGGVGLLVKIAREKLDPADFAKLAGILPGVDEWIKDAPDGGLMNALGGFASALGGKGSDVGLLAKLAGGFSQLGIDKDTIAPFAQSVGEFLKEKGGDEVAGLIAKYTG